MNAEFCVEWLRRQGYRVVRTPSSYWFELGPHCFQAFPFHWLIQPHEGELRKLLLKHKAVALRYSTPVGARQGKMSYHVVCDGPEFELAELPRRARQNVRRGLKFVRVEPISLQRLADEGWNLRCETLARQGRSTAECEDWWRDLCESAADLPGFEAWGALDSHDCLVSSFLTFTCGEWYCLPYQQSASSRLGKRVNNALFYAVTHAVLQRPEISRVFLGLQSLDAPASVDVFKFRMGYTARPVRQRVVFNPLLAPFLNRVSHAAVTRLCGRRPGPALAKAEGMLRFYREGKRPLEKQDWPMCLDHRKHELAVA
jgi:hypothetical protein